MLKANPSNEIPLFVCHSCHKPIEEGKGICKECSRKIKSKQYEVVICKECNLPTFLNKLSYKQRKKYIIYREIEDKVCSLRYLKAAKEYLEEDYKEDKDNIYGDYDYDELL